MKKVVIILKDTFAFGVAYMVVAVANICIAMLASVIHFKTGSILANIIGILAVVFTILLVLAVVAYSATYGIGLFEIRDAYKNEEYPQIIMVPKEGGKE